jgi:hypothetical protein
MAIGSYGTIRPSDVSPSDVEIIMNYTATRDVTDSFVLTKLDAQTILRPYFNNSETGGNAGVEVLGGLYNLTAVPITKDEDLLKVMAQPEIQTNVFVERGKNSAYERVQRLGEVDNLGDLINYGYGFFNVVDKKMS